MIKTIVNWKRAHSERMKKVWAQQCNYRVQSNYYSLGKEGQSYQPISE